MVFNATFSNISVISWLSVLLMEETGGPEENGSVALFRQPITPTAHYSDNPLLRQPITPTAHFSDNAK
jgi:hypothetical protein